MICDPSIYTMDHPDLTVSNDMKHSIGLKMGKVWFYTYHAYWACAFVTQECQYPIFTVLSDKRCCIAVFCFRQSNPFRIDRDCSLSLSLSLSLSHQRDMHLVFRTHCIKLIMCTFLNNMWY